MLRKKETMTIITPIPGFIPRQLAIDILHSHGEVITLNPLVLDHKAIPAPRNAAADEYYSTWYEITERIQVIPGIGKLGGSKITFNGCFHDMPWGLQTHIYAPMNIDMRNRYRIQGNQPGIEAPEQAEIGLEELGAPKDGLYLREDVEFKCNITMMSFVKAETRKASKEMVGRMIKKAELLDAGVLKAMFDNGKLKTYNPQDRSDATAQQIMRQSTISARPPSSSPASSTVSPGFPPYAPRPGSSQSSYPPTPYQMQQQQQSPLPHQANLAPPLPPKTQYAMELPGDYSYYNHPSRSPSLYQQQAPPYNPNAYRTSLSMQSPPPVPEEQGGHYQPGSHGQPPMHGGFTAELDGTQQQYQRQGQQ